jgi:DNA-binding transcriptional ArsR family regulator
MKIDRNAAQTYARWFQALADPSRIVILNLLADARQPMTVGEIVAAVDIGQSTVSHHLKLLAQVGFVHVTQQGTSRYYRVNQRCLAAFPTAAELVMGLPRAEPAGTAPWTEPATGPDKEPA